MRSHRLPLPFVIVAVLSLPFLIAAVLLQELSPAFGILATAIASIVLGAIGAPTFVDWIKHVLKVEGMAALWLVFAIAFVIGALLLFVSGSLTGLEWSVENIGFIAGLFFMAATDIYKRLNPTPQT